MKHIRFLLLIFLISILTAQIFAQENPEINEQTLTTIFPPGATATFSKPYEGVSNENLPRVFIKAENMETVWFTNSYLVSVPLEPMQKELTYLGFTVPQINAGIYEVWFENSSNERVEKFKIKINPALIVRQAVVTDSPNETVQVQVGIDSSPVFETGSLEPIEIRVPIKITSENPEVAEIVGENTLTTDKDGFTAWKIQIKNEGVAKIIAEAEGFEKVELYVVGQKFDIQQLEIANDSYQEALDEVSSYETEAIIAEKELAAQEIKASELTGGNEQKILNQKRAGLKIRERALESAFKNLSIARSKLENAKSQYQMFFSTRNLLPGDLLQMHGTTPIISDTIRLFESSQLNISAEYSHSAIYLGNIDGKPQVAEMLAGGYTVQPLDKSILGSVFVDVFRWRDIAPEKRNLLARKAANYCGDPRLKTKCVPYAYEQIGVMGLAAGGLSGIGLKTAAIGAEILSGGRKKMICSEFVAWVYEDVGFKPQASKWWTNLESSGFLTNLERRKDYTTPNMLKNSNFQKIARLKRIN